MNLSNASRRPFPKPVAAILAVATAIVSCTSTSDDVPTVRIAFFQDLSVPEHVDLVSPSFLALEMVLERRTAEHPTTVEIVQLDTGADESEAIGMANEVAADPSYVAAVAAPFWHEPPEVARILAEAGVPTLSLSPVSASPWLSAQGERPPGDPIRLWRRFVPDQREQARLLADVAASVTARGSREPVCLVDDASDYGVDLAETVEAELRGWPTTRAAAAEAPAAVAASGCEIVVWSGFPPGARELAHALREAGETRGRPVDLAGDAMKTVIPPTSPSGNGVVVGSVTCPCADVTLDLALPSRRFVNAYQSEHGLTPGVYAAEGWDVGGVLAGAVASGAVDRAAMRAWLAPITVYDGVAGRYGFDDRGELIRPSVGLFVASGTRWLPLPV